MDTYDRTVRQFIASVRRRYGIIRKDEPLREYEAVEEIPRGYQMQLDFGEKTVRDV